MPSSKTEIANRALSKLGETRVSNIDTDTTKKAKVISYMWNSVRDATIAQYPWAFAIKRKQIASDAETPLYDWSYSYSLPVDFLALLEIQDIEEWVIEGGKILTNKASPIKIRYIARITDTSKYDAMFVEAFSTRLAFEGCEEITQSNTKKELLYKQYLEEISAAYANNAIQEPPQKLRESDWNIARFSGNDEIDYTI